MRYQEIIALWSLVESVSAGPTTPPGKLTSREFFTELVKRPQLIPSKSFRTIEKYASLVDPPKESKTSTSSWSDFFSASSEVLINLPKMFQTGILSTSPDVSRAPKSTVPEMQVSQSPIWPGAKRIRMRYGPYRMPPKSEKNFNSWLWDVGGSATNVRYNAKKPCEGECAVLSAVADMEYFDGSPANLTTEAFFHHVLLLNTGRNVKEATCGQPFIENMFLSGTEKTQSNYTVPGSKFQSGYKLTKDNTFAMLTEIQNMSEQEKFIWQVVTYDIIEEIKPNFKHVQPVWLTIGHTENPSLGLCHSFNTDKPFGETNLTQKDYPKAMTFSEHSKLWKATDNGFILHTGGHLHSGGINMEIFHNKKVVCNSVPTYGRPGEGTAHSHGSKLRRQIKAGYDSNKEVAFIEGMSICQYPEGVPIKKGDTVHIQANYDFTKQKGVVNIRGDLDQVMAMASVWVTYTDSW